MPYLSVVSKNLTAADVATASIWTFRITVAPMVPCMQVKFSTWTCLHGKVLLFFIH